METQRSLVSLFLVLCACRGDAPSGPVISSTPQSQPLHVELHNGTPPLPELASPEALQAAVPAFAGLEEQDLFLVVGVSNLVPAPCVPCFDDRSLGVCLLAPPPGCENLSRLAERAVQLAGSGVDKDGLREALSYAEPWFSDPTASDHPERVDVEVWVAPGAPGAADVFSRIAAIQQQAPVAIHLRVIGDTTDDLAGRALAAAIVQGKGEAWLSEAQPGEDEDTIRRRAAALEMDVPRFEQDWASSRIDVEVIRSKGVRSSPTWFVEGYRLRGLQSEDALGRLVKMEAMTVPLSEPVQP